ncbi:PREDICTED: sodium- and chloride-dependent glycine transporter 2-like [Priapulus caudatus]|uniref:Sodium- and chloride-dependent glycine transporter 2-like n=1 Tax=Priapulus caudatus TaxID=37621 RepID=A0ABM1EGS6_PRICU|nr:PREDICTED: sodium- and chloride-dependent glycine transporter 2-like [Priapulus caudatus]
MSTSELECAFLIPYTVSLLVAGLPIFFMELAFGQYASLGPVTIWKVAPLFQGTGYAMVVVSFLLGMYYNVLNGYSFFYMFHSFHWELPWSTCGNDWNSAACSLSSNNCTAMNGTIYNGTCVTADDVGDDVFATLGKPKSPSEEYFQHRNTYTRTPVFHRQSPCLSKMKRILEGATSVWHFHATYFTALFPYFVLTVLLVRGVTLPGSGNGLMFYLYPKWEYLLTAKVWGDAAVQIFFDLSPCWGGLIALASYNKFHNNCLRDALVVSFGNCLTSVYAGFAIFSLVGYMAYELGVDVENVVAKGPGLAFIAYPAGLARLPGAPIFAVLFFMMLLSLGLGTQFTIVETVVTAVTDEYPKLFRKRKWLILGIVCIISYLVGLVFCTNTACTVLTSFDNYARTFARYCPSRYRSNDSESHGFTGADRFLENIAHMLGYDPWPRLFWKIIWKWACPILLTVILIFTLYDFDTLKYGEYDYPSWADGIGWVLSVISILFIPLIAVIAICKEEGSLLTSYGVAY